MIEDFLVNEDYDFIQMQLLNLNSLKQIDSYLLAKNLIKNQDMP